MTVDAEARLRKIWRQIIGHLDYAITLARLWVYDRIAGPFPMTGADGLREHRKERLRRAFPDIDIDGTGPPRRGKPR